MYNFPAWPSRRSVPLSHANTGTLKADETNDAPEPLNWSLLGPLLPASLFIFSDFSAFPYDIKDHDNGQWVPLGRTIIAAIQIISLLLQAAGASKNFLRPTKVNSQRQL